MASEKMAEYLPWKICPNRDGRAVKWAVFLANLFESRTVASVSTKEKPLSGADN